MSFDNTLALDNSQLLQLQFAYIFARAMGHRWTDTANGAVAFNELESMLGPTLDDTSTAIRAAVLERDPQAWGILAPERLQDKDEFQHESGAGRVIWYVTQNPTVAEISIFRKYSDAEMDVVMSLLISLRSGALEMRLFPFGGCAARHVRKIVEIFEAIREIVGLEVLAAEGDTLRADFARTLEYAADDARQEMRRLLDASVTDYTNPYTGGFPGEPSDSLYMAERIATELGSLRAAVYHLLNEIAPARSGRPRRGPRPPKEA